MDVGPKGSHLAVEKLRDGIFAPDPVDKPKRRADDADTVDSLPLLANPYSGLETRGGTEDHAPVQRLAGTGSEEGNQLGVLLVVLGREIGILLRMGMNEENRLVDELRTFGNRDIGVGHDAQAIRFSHEELVALHGSHVPSEKPDFVVRGADAAEDVRCPLATSDREDRLDESFQQVLGDREGIAHGYALSCSS